MPKTIEHIHWPDAPDLWMPYAPAIKVRGGTTVYLAGVTAAPVYHHHPHRPEEFDAMPRDMAGQARAALENLKRGLNAVGASFADVVTADRFVTDLYRSGCAQPCLGRIFSRRQAGDDYCPGREACYRSALSRRNQRDRRRRLRTADGRLATVTGETGRGTVLPVGRQRRSALCRMSNRTALIVGVGGGLCASIARTFAKSGLKVALAHAGVDDLAPLAKEIGGKSLCLRRDKACGRRQALCGC